MTLSSGQPAFVAVLWAISMVLLSGDGFGGADTPRTEGGRPVELFVATVGNDAWSGTLPAPNAEKDDGPFATLARARDEIRKRKTEQTPAGGFVVSVRRGRYYSAPEAMLYKYRSGATRFLDDFECDGNLVWHQGAPLLVGGLKDVPAQEQWDTWREMGFDRNSVVADPLVVDPANDDDRLRPDSPAFQLGFKPIPVEKIGPYESRDRASWPIVDGPGAREAGFVRATIDTQPR